MESIIEFVKEIIVADKEFRDILDFFEETFMRDCPEHVGSEPWVYAHWGAIYSYTLLRGRSDEYKQKAEALTRPQQMEAMKTILATRREWIS